MENIREIVKQYIFENFLSGATPDELSDDADLQEDGVLDSLATLKLVSFLEDRFRIDFMPEDLESDNLSSLVKIERLVREKAEGHV